MKTIFAVFSYFAADFHTFYYYLPGVECMKGAYEERAIELGEYIIESKATVRAAAKAFHISNSTVHKDVAERLKTIEPQLYREVKKVLETNKAERHIRGGMATKNKYMKTKQ